MKHIMTGISCSVVLFVIVFPTALGNELTARGIMEKMDRQLQSQDETVEVNFTLVNKRGKTTRREFEMFSKQISPTEERRFLRFTAPGDIKGTILLTYDHRDKADNIWLFLPALGRPRRIPSGNKKDSFVGSDLTFEDLENVDLENTGFELLRNEERAGKLCYVVEGVPTTEDEKKESRYSKRVFWIGEKTFLPVEIHHFDKKGVLLKVLKSGDAWQIVGTEKIRLFHVEMENVQKNSKTILQYNKVELDTGISASIFSQRMLK